MNKLLYIFSFLLLVSCSASRRTQNNETALRKVMISTDYGNVVLELYNKTPLHRKNFLKLVKEHFYDSLLFHRVIKDFMIQGGDPESRHAKPGESLGEGGLKYTVSAEFDTSLYHKRGALAAAREPDAQNPRKRSSATQFYIVEGKTYTNNQMDKIEDKMHIKIPENHRAVYRTIGGDPFLDMSYTVFGEIISGFDVVEKISKVPTDSNDRPLKDVRMKITLIK
jgi:cyclophilin family peptidyl-prolyl cis-trans isomerase